MTDASEWRGRVGDVWADEWRRTDRAFSRLSPALDRAILAAAPSRAFRALDIGCGAGATSITLADARADAQVTGVDVSAALVVVAQDRAGARRNLRFETGDAVDRAAAHRPVDLLLSRHGVMFFADPAAAFGTLRAATAPGGALVFSCFADPARNGFAGPLAKALGLRPPISGDWPGPFAFADRRDTAALLAAAGWRLTDIDQVAFDYRVGEGPDAVDDAVGFLSRIGPAAAAMRTADGTGRAALAAGLRQYLAQFHIGDAVDLAASAWLVTARSDP